MCRLFRLRGPDECGRLCRVDAPVRGGSVGQLLPHPVPANHGLPKRLAAPPPGVGPGLQRHAGHWGAASLHRAVRTFSQNTQIWSGIMGNVGSCYSGSVGCFFQQETPWKNILMFIFWGHKTYDSIAHLSSVKKGKVEVETSAEEASKWYLQIY